MRELIFAARTLRRAPRFTLFAAALLAVGIGANTMLFSIADAVLLRPFPFDEQDRLVIAGEDLLAPRSEITYLQYQYWRARTRTFDDLAAVGSSDWTWRLRTNADSVGVRYRVASGNFFELLGTRAFLGRVFGPDDDRRGSERTIVLSYGFWQRQFGGDRAVVGRALVLSETPFTVIGILPPDFRFVSSSDVWTPLVPDLAAIAASIPNGPLDSDDVGVLYAVGRLKPGASVDGARLDLDRLIADRMREKGRVRHVESRVRRLVDEILGSARARTWSLLAAVTVLLLVACANVAGLLLVRMAGRSRELAVRLALGASRASLARQIVFETLLLSAVAVALAVVAAPVGLPLLIALLPDDPRIADAVVDVRAFAFTMAIGMAAAVLSSLTPALNLARRDLDPVLRRTGRAVVTAGLRQPTRRLLIVVELALAVVLLNSAALLARSVVRLGAVELGFNPHQLLSVRLSMPSERMAEPDARALLDRAARELARIPGVASVAGISLRPLLGPIGVDSPFRLEAQTAAAAERNPYVNAETITPQYFHTMQTAVIEGRDFTDDDRETTSPVVIVSKGFADRAWPGESAIGKRLQIDAFDRARPIPPLWTVVGVSADVRYRGLEAPTLTAFVPFAQSPDRINDFVVRLAAADRTIVPFIRQRLGMLNGNAGVRVEPMDDVLSALERPWRSNLMLFGMFAGLTVALAAAGLYAMLAYTVVEQSREIGLRLVLGASQPRIAAEVIAAAARVVVLGLVAGLMLSAAGGRLIQSLLFDINPLDPMALAAGTVALALVAIVACVWPAVRAARVEPAVCLRVE
jgi:predicted permease